MTVRAQLGAIPGAGDLFSLLRFLDPANDKEFTKHIKQLDERTQAHLDAVAVHGKAEDIERIHGEAEDWEKRAIEMFEKRQNDTEAGETLLKIKQTKDRKHFEEVENEHRQLHGGQMTEARNRLNEAKAREDAVQIRETNAANKERAAAKMRDAGKAMKDEYEKKMRAIQGIAAA